MSFTSLFSPKLSVFTIQNCSGFGSYFWRPLQGLRGYGRKFWRISEISNNNRCEVILHQSRGFCGKYIPIYYNLPIPNIITCLKSKKRKRCFQKSFPWYFELLFTKHPNIFPSISIWPKSNRIQLTRNVYNFFYNFC